MPELKQARQRLYGGLAYFFGLVIWSWLRSWLLY